MNENTGPQIVRDMLELFANQKPILVSDFLARQRTGDSDADALLDKVSLLLLSFLKANGFIKADDPSSPAAKVHGLTSDGEAARRLYADVLKDANL